MISNFTNTNNSIVVVLIWKKGLQKKRKVCKIKSKHNIFNILLNRAGIR